ncbi:MAG: excisionase family DNA-binding protein [Nitrospinota bacterium]
MIGKKDVLQAEKKFLSIQALAKRWNVSASTVRRIIDEGRLKGIRVRKSFKIDLDSVLDYESTSSF